VIQHVYNDKLLQGTAGQHSCSEQVQVTFAGAAHCWYQLAPVQQTHPLIHAASNFCRLCCTKRVVSGEAAAWSEGLEAAILALQLLLSSSCQSQPQQVHRTRQQPQQHRGSQLLTVDINLTQCCLQA